MKHPQFFTHNQLAYLVQKLQRIGKTKEEIARLLECAPEDLDGYQKGHYFLSKTFQLKCLQVFNTNFKRD